MKVFDQRIDEIISEECGGYFVYLKKGYAMSNPPQHCFGEDTKKQIQHVLASQVYKCECDSCRAPA